MNDLISREDAIRWVKTECNPYGKPTLDFESGKKVIEHLEQMPSAQPDWIPCSDRLPKKGNVVLITNEKGNVKHGQYRGVHYMASDGTYNWWWKGNRTEGVLAWMPLPTPWEGGQDEQKG